MTHNHPAPFIWSTSFFGQEVTKRIRWFPDESFTPDTILKNAYLKMLDDILVGVLYVLSDKVGDGGREATRAVQWHDNLAACLDHAVGKAHAVVVFTEERGLDNTKQLILLQYVKTFITLSFAKSFNTDKNEKSLLNNVFTFQNFLLMNKCLNESYPQYTF